MCVCVCVRERERESERERKRKSLRFLICKTTVATLLCLSPGSPEADPERRSHVNVIYQEASPGATASEGEE